MPSESILCPIAKAYPSAWPCNGAPRREGALFWRTAPMTALRLHAGGPQEPPRRMQ